jgi:branched-chain amino acid transport system permease protein
MVLIMIWKPRGLLSHRAPTVRLFKDRKAKLASMSEGHG